MRAIDLPLGFEYLDKEKGREILRQDRFCISGRSTEKKINLKKEVDENKELPRTYFLIFTILAIFSCLLVLIPGSIHAAEMLCPWVNVKAAI